MDETNSDHSVISLQPAIDFFGSQAELARRLGVNPMRVYQWSRRGVPAKWAVKIDEISGGQVPRHRIRPDLFEAAA